MESFHCKIVTIKQNDIETGLDYESAVLFVHTESDGFKSWFVDITGLNNPGYIEKLLSSSDINIYMKVLTTSGVQLEGEGHIHPNLANQNATIRGNNELIGYLES